MNKTCTKCGETKPATTEYFYSRHTRGGQLYASCKECVSKRARRWRKANAERHAENGRRWREENRAQANETAAKWRDANPDKVREQQRKSDAKPYRKAYREANKEQIAERSRRWYEENKERRSSTAKIWREENAERVAAARRRWMEENRGKVLAWAPKRKAAKLQRTPPWLTDEHHQQIGAIYAAAAAMSDHHVDHIVPLRGENVSGLHVPWNLQILPASENRSKSNKFDDWTTQGQQIAAST